MIDEICRLIHERQNFVITGHSNPDGDSIGSCFAMALALTKLGKTAKVVLENYAKKYEIIPGREHLNSGKLENLDVDVLICMDCADIERLGDFKVLFARAKTTVCIDHHETNIGFADYNFILPEASSTAEMVFVLIEKLTFIDFEIASAIYAGIVSDTGGFRYHASAKSTLEIAGRLMEIGIDFTEIYSELLHKHSFAGMKILSRALDVAQQTPDGRIIYTYVTRKMMKETGAKSIDLDGIVEYLMTTRGADVAVFMYERNPTQTVNEVKASFRSRGVHVGRVAHCLGGGGHRLAAGCTLQGDIGELLPMVVAMIESELAIDIV